MNTLAAIQDRLVRDIFPESSAAELHTTIQPRGLASSVSPRQRIDIYRNNTQQALLNCLRKNFPHCARLLAHDFDAIAQQSIVHNIPMQRDLNRYGDFFPGSLRKLLKGQIQTNTTAIIPAFLPALAEAEYALLSCYYANNSSAFDTAAFAQLAPEQQHEAQFQLAASAQLLRSYWPLHTLINGGDSDVAGQGVPAMPAGCFLIYREHFRAEITVISRYDYLTLKAIAQGASLHTLSKHRLTRSTCHQLASWIAKGWISSFSYGADVAAGVDVTGASDAG